MILVTHLVWARAYWIKATLGITGWSHPIVHIDDAVRHLDVVLAHPGPEEGAKGWSVRPLKRCVSWVQSVARQLTSVKFCRGDNELSLLLDGKL